ncbi:MAG: hypothetical protein D6714_15785 [Bacteroidetes bacterium]|nr:MAG: hypothetical protein D6714_15785 [Bacteroidota bacterium]
MDDCALKFEQSPGLSYRTNFGGDKQFLIFGRRNRQFKLSAIPRPVSGFPRRIFLNFAPIEKTLSKLQ